MLLEDISNAENNPQHVLSHCTLGEVYIGENSTKLPNAAFERGVVKIQNEEANLLTELERAACSHLQLDNVLEDNEEENELSYEK